MHIAMATYEVQKNSYEASEEIVVALAEEHLLLRSPIGSDPPHN